MKPLDEKRLKDFIGLIESRKAYTEEIARFEAVLKICRPEFEEKLKTNIERNRAWLNATENNIIAVCKLIAEA